MRDEYPQRNPFPHQGVMVLEGQRFDADASKAPIPTALRLSVTRCAALMSDYVESFDDESGARGQSLLIHGRHGTGKTHAIFHALQQLHTGGASAATASRKAMRLYAKIESSEFGVTYRRLMTGITAPELTQVIREFTRAVAAEQIAKEFDADDLEERLQELSEETLRELFNSYLLEEGAVREAKALDLRKAGGNVEDFFLAFTYLRDQLPRVAEAAYQWLTGGEIAPDLKKRIGLSKRSMGEDQMRWGLHILALLFGKIRRPLIVVLDQIEKMTLDVAPGLASQNLGRLHSLVEAFPQQGCFLALVGNEASYEALPRDLIQRFAGNVVEVPILALEEAADVVQAYVTLPEKPFTPTSADVPIKDDQVFPFVVDGIKELLRLGGGTIRSFLQGAHAAFRRAAPDRARIDAAAVRLARPELPSAEELLQQISAVVRRFGLTVEKQYALGDLSLDVAALDDGGQPRLLIEIKEAAFHVDEVELALESMALSRKLLGTSVNVTPMVIMRGYASPTVLAAFAEVLVEAIVYDPDTFGDDFQDRLEQELDRQRTGDPRAANKGVLEGKLAAVSKELEDVLKSRETESSRIDERLGQLLDRKDVDHRFELLNQTLGDLQKRVELHQVNIEQAESQRRRSNRGLAAMIIGLIIALGAAATGVYSVISSTRGQLRSARKQIRTNQRVLVARSQRDLRTIVDRIQSPLLSFARSLSFGNALNDLRVLSSDLEDRSKRLQVDAKRAGLGGPQVLEMSRKLCATLLKFEDVAEGSMDRIQQLRGLEELSKSLTKLAIGKAIPNGAKGPNRALLVRLQAYKRYVLGLIQLMMYDRTRDAAKREAMMKRAKERLSESIKLYPKKFVRPYSYLGHVEKFHYYKSCKAYEKERTLGQKELQVLQAMLKKIETLYAEALRLSHVSKMRALLTNNLADTYIERGVILLKHYDIAKVKIGAVERTKVQQPLEAAKLLLDQAERAQPYKGEMPVIYVSQAEVECLLAWVTHGAFDQKEYDRDEAYYQAILAARQRILGSIGEAVKYGYRGLSIYTATRFFTKPENQNFMFGRAALGGDFARELLRAAGIRRRGSSKSVRSLPQRTHSTRPPQRARRSGLKRSPRYRLESRASAN